MALVFFKIPKNKKFNYKPVFYDQKKEEREKHTKSAIDSEGDFEQALRDRMRLRWKRTTGASDKKASQRRLILIIIVIILLFYLVFRIL